MDNEFISEIAPKIFVAVGAFFGFVSFFFPGLPRLSKRKTRRWISSQSKGLKFIIFVGLPALFLLALTFFVWNERQRLKSIRANEADKSLPKLSGRIEGMLRGLVGDNPKATNLNTDYMVEFSIRNLGVPSIAEGFRMSLWTNRDFQGHQFDSVPHLWQESPNGTMDIHTISTGEEFSFKKNDMIFEKAAQPIQQGDKITGWIPFQFKGSNTFTGDLKDLRVVISYQDVTGRRIFTTNDDLQEYSGKLHYLPGTRYPQNK